MTVSPRRLGDVQALHLAASAADGASPPFATLAFGIDPIAMTGRTNAGQLTLATSGGVTEAGPALHPCFFRGFLTDPGPAAQALLVTAAVARARTKLAEAARLLTQVA